jgi:N-acetylneuraminic acid mutarotase
MKRVFLSVVALLLSPAVSSAHFLWLVSHPEGSGAKVQVFFGEEAGPDDPALLDKVSAAQVWLVGGRDEPTPVSLTKGAEALEGTIANGGQYPLILEHNYGVITKGGDAFLLKYFAKTYASPLTGTWTEVGNKEHLPLEIVPLQQGHEITFRVDWQGTPLPNSTVTIVGPGIEGKIEGTTNEQGVFTCKLPQAGQYSIRAKHSEATAGTHKDQEYKSIRYYSTLTLKYQPARLVPEGHSLPDLPRGTTSFGGAIANDMLHVFAGNYGDAHSYHDDGQSGDLWILDLKRPTQWTKSELGPKLQGLSMAAYNGRVYRVGGFAALNKEGEPDKLVSQSDFARLNADGKSWEMLPALPQPRSSHDVAVVGDTLYVVGGWNMKGNGKNATWHENVLSYDLKTEQGQWKEIATPPFIRRALAAAAWNGKLVVIGGMNKVGGPTRDVAIYDPTTNTWSQGPTIHGGTMDGFGCSAFAVGQQLIVTTVSGSIQGLSPNQSEWEYLGQLDHNRFFHRVLPLGSDSLLIVGGANMEEGKTNRVEVLRISSESLGGR